MFVLHQTRLSFHSLRCKDAKSNRNTFDSIGSSPCALFFFGEDRGRNGSVLTHSCAKIRPFGNCVCASSAEEMLGLLRKTLSLSPWPPHSFSVHSSKQLLLLPRARPARVISVFHLVQGHISNCSSGGGKQRAAQDCFNDHDSSLLISLP